MIKSVIKVAFLLSTGLAFQACSNGEFAGKKALESVTKESSSDKGSKSTSDQNPETKPASPASASPGTENQAGAEGTGNEGLKADGKTTTVANAGLVEKQGWNNGLPECEKMILAPGKGTNPPAGGSVSGGWGAVTSAGEITGEVPKCIKKEVLDGAAQYVFCELGADGKVSKCYPWEKHAKFSGFASGGVAYGQCASAAGSVANNVTHCSASACCFKTKSTATGIFDRGSLIR
jgi:hypothetical protein